MTEETKAAIRECMEIADKHAGGMPISVELRRRFPEAWEPVPADSAYAAVNEYGKDPWANATPEQRESTFVGAKPGIPSWDWWKWPEGRKVPQNYFGDQAHAKAQGPIPAGYSQRPKDEKPKPFPLPMGC